MSQSYREAGTGGHARSTVLGKTSALNHFVTFLGTKNLVYEACGQDELCNESNLRQFGTYLIEHALAADTGLPLARDTAIQYFSGVTNVLKAKYKDDNLFRSSETWNKKCEVT